MSASISNPAPIASQEDLYRQVARDFGPALSRLAASYQADPEKRPDLLQEIHIALWRSLESFAGRCSLRTWVYRVAHNVAASHVMRDRRWGNATITSLEEIEEPAGPDNTELLVDRGRTLERLQKMIQQLQPLDRQIILLYLEGLDGASIGEIAGISPGNAGTKISRIKTILARRFHEGARI
jgi:RNA polymerase sigma-70 factor (ECF subfamily)